jgi:hypothetical protein
VASIPPISPNSPIKPSCPDAFKWCVGCQKCLPKIWFKGKKLCRTCAPEKERGIRLLANFGLTVIEYEWLLKHQGGVCAICQNPPKNSRYHVDHNHKTGAIRGILCMWCNHKLLAGARESIKILKAAIAYLEHPPAMALLGVRIVPPRLKKKKKLKLIAK